MGERTIKLGETEFTITVPLTLGQLMEANVGMALPASADPLEEARNSYKRTLNVLIAALKPENPNVTVESLMAIRGATLTDFNKAALIAYEESGLITRKDDSSGEAVAEAA